MLINNLHELTDFIIFFFKAVPDRRIVLLSSSFLLSFVNGCLFRAKHMTKCILIKIRINSFSISTKTLIFLYYSRVLRRLHVACTINVAFDAMQKLLII